jgi:preprotein translocase subunit SecG
VEDPPDYGAGLFTIPDDEEDDDDELFAHSLDKGPPRREDSGDSAYEDASGDDDDGTGSAASDDPAPFAKYTGEEAAEDEENPFGKYAYVSKSTRRAARRKEDEELMDDLFPEETAAGGRGHGGGGGGRSGGGDEGHIYNDYGGDEDEYDGLDDDDDDESPRNAKSKDSGAGTTPTGMISYGKDFDDADYELDGLDKNYDAIRAYEKRRGMLTNRQWAAVLAVVTCVFILLMIIIGLSVALVSSKNKNDTSTSTVGMDDGVGGSTDGQSASRLHLVAQSYLQTYSGQDIAMMESTAMIERYEELMASYLTYYVDDSREDNGVLNVESVAVKCTFNFQRLSSSAARDRRHQFGGGRERRQLWRGLRRRRTQGQDLPPEVTDAVEKINKSGSALEIKRPAPGFSDVVDGSKQPGIPMPIPSEMPSCPPGMKSVRDKSKKLIGCTPVAADEKLPTSAAEPISNEMVFTDEENPLDELDGEADIATATVHDVIAAQEDGLMHLEIDYTMTWSASRHEKPEKDDDSNKLLRDLNNFPKRFENFMNSERGKRQQLHDLTKVLGMEIEVISDVIERETLKNKFTDAPTIAPTPAPSVATSSQPTPQGGCCYGVCWFSC